MQLTDLQARLGRNISLSATQWAFAWLLGETRRESNAKRAPSSHRGESGNRSVDLHGALGELLLFGFVRELGDTAAVDHSLRQLYVPAGGRAAKGADVSFMDNGTPIGLDVKTFDCDPKKRFFAINDHKHQELQGHCDGYVGLICPAFATQACLTQIIPYDDVSQWPLKKLLESGTPSRNLPITELMTRYCGEPYSIAASRRMTYAEASIVEQALQTGPGSVGERWTHLIPEIKPAVRNICERSRDRLGSG